MARYGSSRGPPKSQKMPPKLAPKSTKPIQIHTVNTQNADFTACKNHAQLHQSEITYFLLPGVPMTLQCSISQPQNEAKLHPKSSKFITKRTGQPEIPIRNRNIRNSTNPIQFHISEMHHMYTWPLSPLSSLSLRDARSVWDFEATHAYGVTHACHTLHTCYERAGATVLRAPCSQKLHCSLRKSAADNMRRNPPQRFALSKPGV